MNEGKRVARMNTYLTYIHKGGKIHAGPDILAPSWETAEWWAYIMSVQIAGEKVWI